MTSVTPSARLMPMLVLLGLGGCFQPDYEGQVRQRTEELIGYLFQDDLDACVQMTDPEFVRAQGTGGVKLRFGLILGLSKLGRLTQEDVRIDQVTVGPDAEAAQVHLSVQTKAGWKSLESLRWIRDQDTWYVTF